MTRKPIRGRLLAAAHHPADLPKLRPVVALVGRSNVGKSSLLNRLLGVAAARTSKKPGRTRGIYFYETGEGHYLADLPGIGFAQVPLEERQGWMALTDAFFTRGGVGLVLRLVDPRAPDAEADSTARDYLADLGIASITVATKWDRLKASQRPAARALLEARHGEVVPVSSKSGEGIETLRRLIRQRIAKDGSDG
ncbi:MAG TPA: ribosome biogenesis GTP-binding protein YihA/YsxC [Thermoanaerobaculia bacterium]